MLSFIWIVRLFKPFAALATIWVNAGTYQIAAIVRPAKSGPEILLNAKTHSQCLVKLRGAEAKKWKLTKPTPALVKVRVDKVSICRKDMEAELLEQQPLGDAKISRILGNDFIPLNL